MRDQEGRATGGHALQGVDDRPFVLLVQAGGGLVQDEDRGLADRRPGDRDALALAVRERHAALTQHRVIALRQRLDEAGGVGETRRRLDRFRRGARSAVGDVVAHRRGEEQAVLKHHAHLRAERRERVLAHVARVDQHAPRGGVVQPEHEARECGLTASGRPHESDAPPRLDVAVDLLQRLPPRLVREVHALEPDRAAQCRRGHGAGEIPHVGSAVEEIEHALPRSRGSCEATRVLGGVLHGTEGVFHVCEEHDEVARRHRAVQHEPRAEPQHQGRAERDEQVHRTLEPGGQPRGVRARRQILAVLAGEGLRERALEGEGANHLDRADRLGRGGGHGALLAALLPGRLVDAPAAPRRGDQEEGSGREREQGERRVQREHHRRHADDGERVCQPRQERRDGHVLQHADVADDPHDQVAGPRPVVEREREPLQLAVQLVPYRRQHAVADEREPDGAVVGRERPQPGEHDDRDRGHREQRRRVERLEETEAGDAVDVRRAEHAVQHELERPGLEQPEGNLAVEREERDDDQRTLATQVRPTPSQQASQPGERFAQGLGASHLDHPTAGAPRVSRTRCMTSRALPTSSSVCDAHCSSKSWTRRATSFTISSASYRRPRMRRPSGAPEE